MRAINHALTGAIIGLAIGEPLIAVPAAVASHFVMDAIPHHGDSGNQKARLEMVRSNFFRQLLYADAFLCFCLVLLLATNRPAHWFLAAVCAFAAAAPDLLSFNLYRRALSGKGLQPRTLYGKFASKIQWFERPIGAVVEVTWFVAALLFLLPFLR